MKILVKQVFQLEQSIHQRIRDRTRPGKTSVCIIQRRHLTSQLAVSFNASTKLILTPPTRLPPHLSKRDMRYSIGRMDTYWRKCYWRRYHASHLKNRHFSPCHEHAKMTKCVLSATAAFDRPTGTAPRRRQEQHFIWKGHLCKVEGSFNDKLHTCSPSQ